MGVVSLVKGLENEQMELSHFSHAGTNSGKLVKNGQGFLVHETLVSVVP